MRILIIHRYFWPDSPPYASMLRSMAKGLADAGHEVTVLSTQPTYKPGASFPHQARREKLDGFEVIRCRLLPENSRNVFVRSINMALFILTCSFHVLTQRGYQVVMNSSMPPVLGGFLTRIAARITGAKFVYHCQDIYPEAGRHAGILSNRYFYSALLWMDRVTCENAAAVVVLSKDMVNTIRQRNLRTDARIEIINNFDLPEFSNIVVVADNVFPRSAEKFRILFAGNLGRFQGLENVVKAAHLVADHSDIEFVFMGEGVARQNLERIAGDLLGNSVYFLGQQSASAAKRAMAEADLGLVTLKPGIYNVSYPSKTMTYLSRGTPILAVVESDSAISAFVRNEDIGFVCEPENPRALADVLISAKRKSGDMAEMRERAAKIARSEFSEASVVAKWQALYRSLEQ